MPTTCLINFENNAQKIVFSGQKLHITVRLKLTEEIKVRGIDIHLRGTAHVRFFINGYYAADEDVLDMRKCLVDGKGENQVLPIGTYDYSFTCTLPRDIPSSFSGSYGYIKYTANVVIRIPLWPDKKFDEKFFVFKPVNLNDYPSIRDAVSERKAQTLRHSGEICVSARMPSGGYAYGQSINLQVSVNNTTEYPIYHFAIYILRKTIYLKSTNSEQKSKTEYTIVQKRICGSWICGKQQYKTFPIVSIKVPPMIPPTDTESSKIIKIGYVVSIKGTARDFRESQRVAVSLSLPIMIGTIPFYGSGDVLSRGILPTAPLNALAMRSIRPSQSLQMEPSAPVFPDDDTVSVRTYTSTPPPFPDDDAGLPTYEEAMLMDQPIDVNLQSIEDSFTQLDVKSTTNQ